ncbi:hypothetical protein [Aquimonas voraii]|uniref:DUF2059 domain-containing protein n=1 Tax=Aquimonas voraii TaxID=265719 RepID=A0A1G6RV76_9GAMM|nr:hypothetical protein [Aquimonas voraii]SDD08304.1 hypothetical protein SAMN04488509_101109 [Aquimonas voraii]
MNRFVSLAAAGLFSLGLVACGGGDKGAADPAASTATPDAALKSATTALRQNDIGQFVKLVLPEARYNEVKAKYEAQKAEAGTPDPAEAAEFAEMMGKLTAADAEAALMAELEPHLAQFEAELAPQMPMMIGMGRGMAVQGIQQNAEMSEDQKRQATQVVDALGNWLSNVKLADRELAKQAVAKAVATARALDLKTLEQLQALSFDDALAKAGIAFGGLKDVLAVYGFDINAALDSAQIEVLNTEGDTARVKVGYTLLGAAISSEQDMVREAGRWYGKDTMKAISDALDGQSEAEVAAEEAAPADEAEVTEEPAEVDEEEAATE